MKIALLTDGIWPFVVGGMQKHSYYVCKYLASNKVHVDLYHTCTDINNHDLIEIFSEEELLYIKSYIIPFPDTIKLPGHYIRSSRQYSKAIFEILKDNLNVDLIYAKGLTSWELLRKKLAGQKFPPIAINVHGYEYFQKAASFKSYIQHLILRPAFRFVNNHADYVYSYGSRITDIIKERTNKKADEIIEIPTGIDKNFLIDSISASNAIRRFVFLGRYERRKGLKELSEVIEDLINKYDFRFSFIGDIPLSKQLKSPGITYYGKLSDENSIKAILRESDILICPSYSEGMPNAILEGMASGCAIIATDVGAVALQVCNKNGWLIQSGSVAPLKESFVSALTLPVNELRKMQEQSLEYIKTRFLWSVIIKQLILSFEKIIQDKKIYPNQLKN